MRKPIYVTQPQMPPLDEFVPMLESIWSSRILTNNGPYHQQLEKALCDYLEVDHLSIFSNGTLALITALQALRITGEVITTPFSFVATTHALHWNGIRPVFADIDASSFNLDPKRVEAAITPQTTALLPVHTYASPCAVDELQKIADTYGLKIIYDSAHTFGARYHGKSLGSFGDMSVLSFHATKVFNTFEGGAIICKDAETKRRIDFLKNFGFADEVTVVAPGINGKMNEVQAAFGLLQLKGLQGALDSRQCVDQRYRQALSGVRGLNIPEPIAGAQSNYSYFPVLVGPTYPLSRDQLYEHLKRHDIHARRYFYPLISEFPTYRGLPSAHRDNLPIAATIAERVLCLPIFPGLSDDDQNEIIQLIRDPTQSPQ